jgi:multidrug efflux pump subunit AcrA (membrane-fusion protein)
MSEPSKFISLAKVKTILQITDKELQKEIDSGHLKAYRSEHLTKFKREDINAFQKKWKSKKQAPLEGSLIPPQTKKAPPKKTTIVDTERDVMSGTMIPITDPEEILKKKKKQKEIQLDLSQSFMDQLDMMSHTVPTLDEGYFKRSALDFNDSLLTEEGLMSHTIPTLDRSSSDIFSESLITEEGLMSHTIPALDRSSSDIFNESLITEADSSPTIPTLDDEGEENEEEGEIEENKEEESKLDLKSVSNPEQLSFNTAQSTASSTLKPFGTSSVDLEVSLEDFDSATGTAVEEGSGSQTEVPTISKSKLVSYGYHIPKRGSEKRVLTPKTSMPLNQGDEIEIADPVILPQEDEPVSVRFQSVALGEIAKQIETTGEFFSAVQTPIYSKISGVVKSVLVYEGQMVTKEQPLAYLISEELDQEVRRARFRVAESKSRLKSALIAFEIAKDTYQKEVLHLSDRERPVIHQLAQAEQQIRVAEVEINRLQKEQEQSIKIYYQKMEQGELTAIETAKNALETLNETLKLKGEARQKAQQQYNDYRLKLTQLGNFSLQKALFQREIQQSDVTAEGVHLLEAETELAYQESRLKLKVVRAPINGIISKVHIAPKVYLSQGRALPLFEIFDPTQLEVRAIVDELDIHYIAPRQKVVIDVNAMAHTTFRGYVKSIAPLALKSSTLQKTVFPVHILIEQELPTFRPGLSLKVRIFAKSETEVLRIPLSSISKRSESELEGKEETEDELYHEVVFLCENKKAVARKIKTGRADEEYIEVLDGLKAGDTLIIGPTSILEILEEGDIVIPKEG